MRQSCAIALFLWLAPAIGAQTVKVPTKLEGPSYRLLSLTVESDGKDTKWVASEGLDIFREYHPDSKVIQLRLIAYQEGLYRVSFITAKGDKLSEFAHVAVIIGKIKVPDPPIDPIKPPIKPPVLPPDALGFVSLAATEAAKVPAAARAKSKALADNFEAVASQLAAGGFATPDEANAALRDRNRATLGADVEAWRPWFVAWGSLMDKHNTAGRTSVAHYAAAFNETAAGLRAVTSKGRS